MSDPIALFADMTGTAAQFYVEEGNRVEKGETVLDIECMKSFFPVSAPVGGIVRYKVSLGDFVNQGDLVATIESGDGKP